MIKGISSMATRQLLAQLAAAYRAQSGQAVQVESIGGLDAARRVKAGEAFDLVFLANDTIDQLIAAGHVLPGSRVDLAHSGVAVAVRAGAPQPDISTADALRRAVLAAPMVGYSTGPSGVAVVQLLERWGIADALQGRLVQSAPGVPVATLVARGEVALGFQQLSELLGQPGIDVLGPLPRAVQITTTFSGGICSTSTQPLAAQGFLQFLASPLADAAKRAQGMEPITPKESA
jgi:molybdate transport system substrate-binding protein